MPMPTSGTVSAIVLAAGFSRRMKTSKPLLPLGGQTVVAQVVSIYRDAGVADVRMVVGASSESLRSAVAGLPVVCVTNPVPEKGMFASVLAGVASIPSRTDAFFVHPVDIPLVRPHTLTTLLGTANAHPAPVYYPTFEGRRGHPPLIDAGLKNAILGHDGREGLRGLLNRFENAAGEVPVADEGILLDMDTPADYKALISRRQAGDILTKAECRALMRDVRRVPAPIDSHCRRVAQVAGRLAEAVNARGGAVNAPLIRAAARIHDCARLENNHAHAGALLLEAMGYPAMAAIIARHMDIPVAPGAELDEAQIVYLADKLVSGDTVTDLSRRFAAKLEAMAWNPNAIAAIKRRRRAALAIQVKVERITGQSVAEIVEDG